MDDYPNAGKRKSVCVCVRERNYQLTGIHVSRERHRSLLLETKWGMLAQLIGEGLSNWRNNLCPQFVPVFIMVKWKLGLSWASVCYG